MTSQQLNTIFEAFDSASTDQTRALIAKHGLDIYCAWLDRQIENKLVQPQEIAAWASLPETERVRA